MAHANPTVPEMSSACQSAAPSAALQTISAWLFPHPGQAEWQQGERRRAGPGVEIAVAEVAGKTGETRQTGNRKKLFSIVGHPLETHSDTTGKSFGFKNEARPLRPLPLYGGNASGSHCIFSLQPGKPHPPRLPSYATGENLQSDIQELAVSGAH